MRALLAVTLGTLALLASGCEDDPCTYPLMVGKVVVVMDEDDGWHGDVRCEDGEVVETR